MNLVIGWMALVIALLLGVGGAVSLGLDAPQHGYWVVLVACPPFLASAAGGSGLFEERRSGLLLLTSIIAAGGAVGSVIAIPFTRGSPLDVMLLFLASGGFVGAMLFSLRLHELAKKHVSEYQKWRRQIKHTDEPQFEPLESEQAPNR